MITLYRLQGGLHPTAIGDGFVIPYFASEDADRPLSYVQSCKGDIVDDFIQVYFDEDDVLLKTNIPKYLSVGDRPIYMFKSEEGTIVGNQYILRQHLTQIRDFYRPNSGVRNQIDKFLIDFNFNAFSNKVSGADRSAATTSEVADAKRSMTKNGEKYLVSIECYKKVLKNASDPEKWIEIVSEEVPDVSVFTEHQPEMCLLIAIAGLPVIVQNRWQTYIGVSTSRQDTGDAVDIGENTVKRILSADSLDISTRENGRVCIHFENSDTELNYSALSWKYINIGYLQFEKGNIDSTYDMAVGLDNIGLMLKNFSPKSIKSAWSQFVQIDEVSPERKLLCAVFLHESKLLDDVFSEGLSSIDHHIAPGLQIGLANACLRRSYGTSINLNDLRTNLLIGSIRSQLGEIVDDWAQQDFISGTREDFFNAFDKQLYMSMNENLGKRSSV